MKQIITIKGKPVIEIFESFDGSYWFVTEKAWKQDSLVNGRVYKNDQFFSDMSGSPTVLNSLNLVIFQKQISRVLGG